MGKFIDYNKNKNGINLRCWAEVRKRRGGVLIR
jgi:hypothetical protein